ncbi:hypothetical protein ACFSKM_02060 [Ancylobacter dichloromethanicus]
MKLLSFSIFVVIIAITLGITYWAARRTRTASDFFTPRMAISAPCRTDSRSPATG